MDTVYMVQRPSARLIDWSIQAQSSHPLIGLPKCTLSGLMKGKSTMHVVRRLDAFSSLPGIIPHRKKEIAK